MPLLSLVVPTHNRARYAKACIKSVLGFDEPELQLVVTDTSTDRELYDWLRDDARHLLDDPRLVYAKIDGPSDVTKNHNDAFALATGEYVGVIGDDDCLTNAAIDAVRWASRHDIPAVSQTLTTTYAWPDFRSRLARSGHAERLYVPRKIGGGRWRDAESDLRDALARAFQGTDGLPRTYHGFVRRELLENVHRLTGAFVHGSSPDMAGAVSVACQIGHYLEVDIPLSIPGISGGSNSGRSGLNTHKGELSSDRQTRKFENQGWPRGVPRFFSVETVWAHAGLETVGRLRPELALHFNYARLIALCRLRHSEFEDKIMAATREAEELLGRAINGEILEEMHREKWSRRKYLLRRIMNPTAANGRFFFPHLSDVAAASRRYEEYARENGLVFAEIAKGLPARLEGGNAPVASAREI